MTCMMETVEIGLETVRRYRSWQMSTGSVPQPDCTWKEGLTVCACITLNLHVLFQKNSVHHANYSFDSKIGFYRAMLCIRGTSHGPVCLSVSVCLSQVGVLLKRLNVGYKQHHTIAQGL